MTAQISETLYYGDQVLRMSSQPLDDYFTFANIDTPFKKPHTALWRGYAGTWEILDERLYLIELKGNLQDDTEATLATLFPDYPDRVFAHWFTGSIKIPQGNEIRDAKRGYRSVYERNLFIDIEKGLFKKAVVLPNPVFTALNTSSE